MSQAIELLEDIRHGIDYEFHGKCRCELLAKCNQALTALAKTDEENKALKTMKKEYFNAWSVVYHKCISLGMDVSNSDKSGLEDVVSFIIALKEAKNE